MVKSQRANVHMRLSTQSPTPIGGGFVRDGNVSTFLLDDVCRADRAGRMIQLRNVSGYRNHTQFIIEHALMQEG